MFKSKGSKEANNLPWQSLTAVEQLEHIVDISSEKIQLIFKHSTRCHISKVVLANFEQDNAVKKEVFDLYYLDILQYRDVSNAISSKFNVIHESPQLLLIKDGNVIEHASHAAINNIALDKYHKKATT